MKILTLTEFDPCGYHLRHRRWLRKFGHDYRLAVGKIYWEEGHGADYFENINKINPDSWRDLREFAASADIIQICPAIGQPWSYKEPLKRGVEYHDTGFNLDLSTLKPKIKVALFHGSKILAANPVEYVSDYRAQGYHIASTTWDYVNVLKSFYLPPIVELDTLRANPRQDGEPLTLVHSPSDQTACNTQDVRNITDELNIKTLLISGVSHPVCIAYKRMFPVGFDHLRGSFSINSLENSALGLVPLVGFRQELRELMFERQYQTPPWPRLETVEDLRNILTVLRDDESQTRVYQSLAFKWFDQYWQPNYIASRISETYREMMKL